MLPRSAVSDVKSPKSMTFIVNSADWRFDGVSVEGTEKILEDFLEFVATSRDRNEVVEIGDDFQVCLMRGQQSLWDMFDGSATGLSGELRQEIAAWLGSAQYYADTQIWPQGAEHTEVSIGEEGRVENPDVAWAHHCVRGGHTVACITLGQGGIFATSTHAGNAQLHFVRDERDRKAFWRKRVEMERGDLTVLNQISRHAYPNIHFVDGVLYNLDRLSGGYLAVKSKVLQILSQLDDWGQWVFECRPPAISPGEESLDHPKVAPSNQLIEKRFAGLGILVSPEKPNVRLNGRCRRAREVALGSTTLYCEWHVKIEPHRNRIHFHKPIAESDNKLVVAIIHEHLPLP